MPRSQKGEKRLTVAVTGAGGYLAARLILRLAGEARVERIVGFDDRPPAVSPSKLVFDTLDARSPALQSRFAGVDVVVHLAFVMSPTHEEVEMRDVNVNGTQNVIKCAGNAGVRKLVYVSSGMVYGAHPDNDMPLTEESSLRANLDFSYAAHKLEVEYALWDIQPDYPDMAVAVFRPGIVFGPHADNAWSHLLETPAIVAVKGHEPELQFVHEDDVAAALQFAVLEDLRGAFNLVPDGWLSWGEALTIVGRKVVEMPEYRAWSLMDKLWRWGISEVPPGLLHYIMHPWVMSPAKLAQAGFQCKHSTAEVLAETAERARAQVRLGRLRMRRDTVTRGAAALGVGVAGAAATAWAARRRAEDQAPSA